MLEGIAAMQERQSAAHAEQMEALRAQANLQTQALLQLAASGKCEVCAVDSGDAGSSDTAEGGHREPPVETPQVPVFHPVEDFPLAQSRDDTLRFAFDQ
ncbi:hypothetical protein AAFF_G00074900, partial [Aldrovandia affinis]